MTEQSDMQLVPVRAFQAADRLTVAAPMPGLEPEDIQIEVTQDGKLVLHGETRGSFKGMTNVIIDEWTVGNYHRELELPFSVDGETANATFGNGVLVVVLPIVEQTKPARFGLQDVGMDRGRRVEHTGNAYDK